MLTICLLATAVTVATSPAAPTRADTGVRATDSVAVSLATRDTTRRRPRAVEYSDWYARRLLVHRIASYTELPLFAGEWVLGNKLLTEKRDAYAGRGTGIGSGTLAAHQAVAGGLAALFGINTVTGLWNLYDARHDPAGRGRRTLHTALMLAADAGFAAAGISSNGATENGVSQARTHRNIALVSMGVATVGTGIMWFGRH